MWLTIVQWTLVPEVYKLVEQTKKEVSEALEQQEQRITTIAKQVGELYQNEQDAGEELDSHGPVMITDQLNVMAAYLESLSGLKPLLLDRLPSIESELARLSLEANAITTRTGNSDGEDDESLAQQIAAVHAKVDSSHTYVQHHISSLSQNAKRIENQTSGLEKLVGDQKELVEHFTGALSEALTAFSADLLDEIKQMLSKITQETTKVTSQATEAVDKIARMRENESKEIIGSHKFAQFMKTYKMPKQDSTSGDQNGKPKRIAIAVIAGAILGLLIYVH